MAIVTKPMALDETLQATNSVLEDIRDAIGASSLIGNTDISEIADGTLTGAVEEFDEKLAGISDGANKVESSQTNGNIKIDGTETQVYDDTEIKTVLSTDTMEVEGNPINFTTKSAQNAKSTILSVEPIQDLHGYDKPWVGGAGKNKLPLVLADIKTINTNGTWNGNKYTYNNVEYTLDVDNSENITSISINSSGASGNSNLALTNNLDLVDATNYILNGCPSGGSASSYNITVGLYGSDVGSGKEFTYDASSSGKTVRIWVVSGTSMANKIFYPMIRLATETDATFQPYTNIASISGRTEIGILGTNGKESTDPDYVVSNDLTISFGQTVYGGTLDVENGVLVVDRAIVDLGNLTYNYAPTRNWFYAQDLNSVAKAPLTNDDIPNIHCTCYGKTSRNALANDLIINGYASFDTSANLLLRDLRTTDETEFTSLVTGQKVCYELATPITIQLTPHQISLLEGVNNISTTGDKITLTYRDGKVATLGDLKELREYVDSKPSGGGHNYSTEEQVVGTWIDGKPLYEKSFSVDIQTDGNIWVDTDIVIPNIENIVKYDLIGIDRYVGSAPANIPGYVRYYNNNFQAYLNLTWNITFKVIILQYTKTTD